MKQKFTQIVLKILSQVTGKFFLYIRKNDNNAQGKTAVQDMNGVWHVGNVYDSDDITYGIAQNGFVEEYETKLVETILCHQMKKGRVVFFDIGANIGYYGLIAGKRFEATVHSFEPTPIYAENIKTAAQLNHISDSVYVHNYALSNAAKRATFHQSGSGSSLENDFNLNKDLPTITVDTIELDTAMEKDNLPSPTFMKIDVEGHEWAVFGGAQKTISKHTPVIFLELCTTLRDIGRPYINPHYTETITLLQSLGYEIVHLKSSDSLELWDSSKTINRAGMFLCLHQIQHAELKSLLTQSYTIISK